MKREFKKTAKHYKNNTDQPLDRTEELKAVMQNDVVVINSASELVRHNEQLSDSGNNHLSEFKGLPLETLLGQPLREAKKAQQELTSVYVDTNKNCAK